MASAVGGEVGLLLAAHGERREGTDNESIVQIANALTARGMPNVSYGFLKGVPAIAEAIEALATREVIVYPLFMSDGYFTQVRLAQELEAARGVRTIRTLPPLGLDPRLTDLIAVKAEAAASTAGLSARDTTIVLVAHGSTGNPASREAARMLGRRIEGGGRFAAVRVALLEEPPDLGTVLAETSGPVVVSGLFVGDGLHGGEDVPALMAQSRRADVIFGGNAGSYPEIADLIAAAVRR